MSAVLKKAIKLTHSLTCAMVEPHGAAEGTGSEF